MKALSATLILALALLALPARAAKVEIVLDVSGSMRSRAGNMTRIEAAQRAVTATIGAIDASSNVALRLYGHRYSPEQKEQSCRDTELVIPFGPLNRERFTAVVQSAKPLGQTPLTYALEQAAADFGDIRNEPAAVILISDREESCGGDPAKVACSFRERGLELTINTVGFDVNNVARQQLQAIASCTGGQYRDVKNVADLSDSLRQMTQSGLLLQKTHETRSGSEVRGGNGYDSAVPISPGTYKLDHHQRSGDFDYFSIDLKPGQMLQVKQEAYEVGISIEGDKIEQNTYPIAGVAIHGPDHAEIGKQANIGPGAKASVLAAVAAGQGGKYYVMIGQDTWNAFGIHKESPFTIQVIDATDARSGTDAGSTERDAVKIAPGTYQAWIEPGDTKDMYTFDAVGGSSYNFVVRPDGDAVNLQLVATDEDRVELASAYAPNNGAVARLENIQPKRSGKLYVAVNNFPTQAAIPYTIELTGAGGAMTTTTTTNPATTDTTSTASSTSGGATEEKRGFFSHIPGGKLTCLGVLFLFVLGFFGIIAAIVMFIRRRSKP